MTIDSDQISIFKQLNAFGARLKLGVGVVGKFSNIKIALFGLWALLIVKLDSSNYIFDSILITVGLIITVSTLYTLNRLLKFAQTNPLLALMEGADVVKAMKFDAQIKDQLGVPTFRSKSQLTQTTPPALDAPNLTLESPIAVSDREADDDRE